MSSIGDQGSARRPAARQHRRVRLLLLRLLGLGLMLVAILATPERVGHLLAPDGRITAPGRIAAIHAARLLIGLLGLCLVAWAGSAVRLWAWMCASTRPPVASALELEEDQPARRGEWLVLAFLGLACVAFWLTHYHYYFVPNADYFSFDRAAREIWSGRLPSSTKRMPLFPFLMGLVAKGIPAEHPELHAALALNIAFSLGSIFLMYFIARRWLGWMAVLPAMLLAATDSFSRWCLQPIVEPSLGFFVLLTVFLFQRRSRWQYVAAFAASLTRYEAAALVPIVVLLNLIYVRRDGETRPRHQRLAHLAGGAAASAGVGLWAVYMVSQGGQRSPYKVWEEKGPLGRLNPEILLTILQDPFGIRLYRSGEGMLWAPLVLLLGLIAVGVWASLGLPPWSQRRSRARRRVSLALLLFLAAYAGIHVSFGIDRARYAYPTDWIVLLYFSTGLLTLARAARRRAEAWWTCSTGYAAGTFLILCAAAVFWDGARDIARTEAVRPSWVYLVFAGALVALPVLLAAFRLRRWPSVALPVAAALAAIMAYASTDHVGDVANGSLKIRDMKSEYRAAGEWFVVHMKPGERAVMLNTEIARFYCDLPPDSLLSLSSLNVAYQEDVERIREQLVRAMRAEGIRYLVFTPRRWLYVEEKPSGGYYHEFKTYLLEPFKGGATPHGFRRLAKIEMAPTSDRTASFVYELLPEPEVK